MKRIKIGRAFSFGLVVLEVLFACIGAGTVQADGEPTADQTELRIRVIDKEGLGVRVLVSLHSDDLRRWSAYTDWSGNTKFEGLSRGNYTLLINDPTGEELYRRQIIIEQANATVSEVILLPNIHFTHRAEIVSLNDLATPPSAYRRYLAGVESIRAGRLEGALKIFDDVLNIYPAHAKSHNARGVVFHIIQKPEQAEDAFRRAIQLDPDALEPRLNLGNLLIETGRVLMAKFELQKAVELDSDNVAGAELLLETLLITHDEDAAALFVRSIHQRNAKHPARLHLQVASTLAGRGKIDLAIEQYSLVLRDQPSFSERIAAETAIEKFQVRSKHN